MALRPDRDYDLAYDIMHSWNIDEASAQAAGGIACVKAAPVPSGHNMGGAVPGSVASGANFMHAGVSNQNTVEYRTAAATGVPIGLLAQDIEVPANTQRYFRNFAKNVALPGEKVTLIRRGWVVTDMIDGNPGAGDIAYVGPSGLISTTSGADIATVGKFETTKDADGFARVYVDL